LRDNIYSFVWDQESVIMATLGSSDELQPLPWWIQPWHLGIGPLSSREVPVISRECIQWAYENLDAKSLYNPDPRSKPKWHRKEGLPLRFLRKYLKRRVFDVDLAPEGLYLPTITVSLNYEELLRFRSELALLGQLHFKKDARIKIIMVEGSLSVVPTGQYCATAALLTPIISNLGSNSVRVDVWASFKHTLGRFYDSDHVLTWPCNNLLGASRDEWRQSSTTLIADQELGWRYRVSMNLKEE
jgi:hypothetical protein